MRTVGRSAFLLGLFVAMAVTPAAFGQAPAAPSNLNVSCGPETATVTWQDNSNNESFFRIWRRPPGGQWSLRAEVEPDETSWVEPPFSLTFGNAYCYTVSAHNTFGQSNSPDEVCGYALAEPVLIGPTFGQNVTSNIVTFSWMPVQNANRYIFFLRPGNTCGQYAQTGATQYIVNLESGTYSWGVVALNISGTTSYSASYFNTCWTFTVNAPSQDTVAPGVVITQPTANDTHTTPNSEVELRGTSSDNEAVTQVTWSNATSGDNGICTGLNNWSTFPIPLEVGENNITVRARDAANNQGTDSITVTYAPPPGLPTVTLAPITEIDGDSAVSGGIVTDEGSSNVTLRGVCWNTTGYPTLMSSKTLNGPGPGIFNSFINGLTPGTTYYIRAYANNSVGTAYSAQVTFATIPASAILPTVAISPITSVTQTTASSGGSVTAEGGSAVTARGVCWNTTGGPTVENSKTTNGMGPGVFNSNLGSLNSNTTYFVRAYATNAAGSGYSTQLEFTTSMAPRYILSLASNPFTGGTISAIPLPLNGSYTAGTVVTLTATPFVGYQFGSWGGAASGTNMSTAVVMYEDRSVTANFASTAPPSQAWFNGRVTDSATATPITGAFVQWGNLDDLTDGAGYYTFASVPCQASDLRVSKAGYGSWSESYNPTCNQTTVRNVALSRVTANLTMTAAGSGTGTVLVNGARQSLPYFGEFAVGAALNLEALPDTGSAFDYWERDGASMGGDSVHAFAITTDASVTARFKQAPLPQAPPGAQTPPCGAMGNCGATGVTTLALSFVGLGLLRKRRP